MGWIEDAMYRHDYQCTVKLIHFSSIMEVPLSMSSDTNAL